MVTGILIMLNNYFHDLATATLVTSALLLIYFSRKLGTDPGPEVIKYFLEVYGKLKAFIIGCIVWIVLGGVVRTLAYRKYEYGEAAGRGQIPVLIAKHILIATALILGIYYWKVLSKRIKEFKEKV